MSTTDRRSWFADLESKAEMNTLAIGIIGEIIVNKSSTVSQKVLEVACTLRDLNCAWDVKTTPAPTGANEENIQAKCSMDVAKVESLVDFPLVELGPECRECLCFKCPRLGGCRDFRPTTMHHCRELCRGIYAVMSCRLIDKKNND